MNDLEFIKWGNAYNYHLFQLYKILNKFKALENLNIKRNNFANFVYNNSSGYISQFI